MAKRKEQEKALKLRKLGWSYSAIKRRVGVSKGTLSVWLRDYPLTKEQIHSLQHSEAAKEKFRETMRKKRENRLLKVLDSESKQILPLSEREMYLSGLMMYWGEGLKASTCTVCVANTDPAVILFTKKWLLDCCGVKKKELRVKLHLYSDMDQDSASDYWSELLAVSRDQFMKPYIKQSTRSGLTEKGLYGHGTCNLMVHNTRLKEKIMMGIKAIKIQLD